MVGILVLRPVNVYHLFYIMVIWYIWYIWYHDMVDFLQSALTACQCLLLFIAVDETGNWRGALEIIIIIIVCKYVFVYLCICVFIFMYFRRNIPFHLVGGWWVRPISALSLSFEQKLIHRRHRMGGATLFGYILQNSLAIILKYCRVSSSGAKENGGDTFVFIVKSRGGPWSPNQVPIIWQTQHCWVNSVKR